MPVMIPPGGMALISSDGSGKVTVTPPPERKSFEFLYNVGGLEKPFEVMTDHWVDRATKEEVAIIRPVLQGLKFGDRTPGAAYENRWTETQNKGGTTRNAQPLAEEEWRYHVVRYSGANASTGDPLQLAFCLIETEPEMLFASVFSQGLSAGFVVNPMRATHFLSHATADDHLVNLKASELEDVRLLADQIRKHDHSILDLKGPLSEFVYLKGTDPMGRLRFLGHIAILESLLSHKPQPTDPYDSITRQVKSKMALIGNRTQRIKTRSYFPSLADDAVWKKLYAYRSAIAHGDKADFKSDLQALKDDKTTFSFVRHAVREVLRFCLSEPTLIRDLKGT